MSDSPPWAPRPQDPTANLVREHVSLLRGLVDIVDQLERWESGGSDAEAARIGRLRDSMVRLLLSHGLRPTARLGTPVDLHFHEVAATRLAGPDEKPDQIVEIVQSGWELMGLGQRLILRVAKVVLAVDNELQSSEENRDE
jgi:molecular chaperone GrpE (heat shock protein)